MPRGSTTRASRLMPGLGKPGSRRGPGGPPPPAPGAAAPGEDGVPRAARTGAAAVRTISLQESPVERVGRDRGSGPRPPHARRLPPSNHVLGGSGGAADGQAELESDSLDVVAADAQHRP